MTQPNNSNTSNQQSAETKKTPAKKKKMSRGKKRDLTITITFALILLFAASIVYFFVDYIKRIDDPVLYTQFASINEEAAVSEQFTVTVTDIAEITALEHYELDTENYRYFVIHYKYKNISEETLAWQKFPYLSVYNFSKSINKKGEFDGWYVPEGEKECEYDFNALRYYAIEQGFGFFNITQDIAPNEEREDADVVKIAKSEFSVDNYFICVSDCASLVKFPTEQELTAPPEQ